jgi:hypothetical protein
MITKVPILAKAIPGIATTSHPQKNTVKMSELELIKAEIAITEAGLKAAKMNLAEAEEARDDIKRVECKADVIRKPSDPAARGDEFVAEG